MVVTYTATMNIQLALLNSYILSTCNVRKQRLCALQASKKQTVSNSSVPPPPPTVEPPPAPARQPKVKQAYRKRRKSDEERLKEQAVSNQRHSGRTKYLSSEDLLQKHAALASRQQPAGPQNSIVSKKVRSRAAHPVVLIDGYNLLHFHPSTKQMMLDDRVEEARSYLHIILKSFAAEHRSCEYVVVYDATSVSQSAADVDVRISDQVRAVFRAGRDADSVIINTIQQHHDEAWREAAAGVAPGSSQQQSYLVYTNDKRIAEMCTNMASDAARVFCHRQKELSQQLQRMENRLNLAPGLPAAAAVAAAAAAARLPSPRAYLAAPVQSSRSTLLDHDTHSWAKQLLGKRRLRQQRQQPSQQAAQQQQDRYQGLSDEELLQTIRTTADKSKSSSMQAADADAAAPGQVGVTGHLDELLAMDLDMMLLDSLEE